MLNHTDTIVAAATPPGEGGIGIIRLSGKRAEEFLNRFFRPLRASALRESHRLCLGDFHDVQGDFIDEVMAVLMRAPRSYTVEDVVEVHCHGGRVIMRRIIDTFLDGGARLAAPGEFTLRAFLNGRLDLAKAEAVIDLIRSRSDSARRVAASQLHGSVSRSVGELNDKIADLLSQVEALIDFPEEDIEFADQNIFLSSATALLNRIEIFLTHFDSGRILREGLSVLILGKPNVGKSSLLNLLLGESRAIVTDIPGTTRDTIEENLVIGGIPLRLVDTAGVRETDDFIEAQGVARAREKIASADLVLLVLDASQPVDHNDYLALQACSGCRVLLVLNKADLPVVPLDARFTFLPSVPLSARSGFGVDLLKQALVGFFSGGVSGDVAQDVIFSDCRHRDALVRCQGALGHFRAALSGGLSPEFLALDLRDALQALGEITGETTPDHILDRIFSRFCIGK